MRFSPFLSCSATAAAAAAAYTLFVSFMFFSFTRCRFAVAFLVLSTHTHPLNGAQSSFIFSIGKYGLRTVVTAAVAVVVAGDSGECFRRRTKRNIIRFRHRNDDVPKKLNTFATPGGQIELFSDSNILWEIQLWRPFFNTKIGYVRQDDTQS